MRCFLDFGCFELMLEAEEVVCTIVVLIVLLEKFCKKFGKCLQLWEMRETTKALNTGHNSVS